MLRLERVSEEAISRGLAFGAAAALLLAACSSGEQTEDERPAVPVADICPTKEELVDDSTPPASTEKPSQQAEDVAIEIARTALKDIQKLEREGADVQVYEAEVPGSSPIPTYAYGVPESKTEGQPVTTLELTAPNKLFVKFEDNQTDQLPISSLTVSFLLSSGLTADKTGNFKPVANDFAAVVANSGSLQMNNLTYSYRSDQERCGGTIANVGKGEVTVAASYGGVDFASGVDLGVSLDTAQRVLAAMRVG